MPPMGFHTKPTVQFLHDPQAILPTASTCSLELRLPTCYRLQEDFSDRMLLGVLGNDGFGGV